MKMRTTMSVAALGRALAAACTSVSALPGTFEIFQIYSDAGRNVQFIVIRDRGMSDCDAGEAAWKGESLTSTDAAGVVRRYTFPSDLPTCATSGKRMLLATQAFAALDLVTPDYLLPDGFIPAPDGRLNFAGVSDVQYAGLPADGITAIRPDGTRVPKLATNLAGRSASLTVLAPFAINFALGGTWYDRTTPGQGFLLEVVPSANALALGWFTWSDTAGDHLWLSGLGPISGDSATVTLQRSSGGLFNRPGGVTSQDVGTATFRFTDCSRGTVTFQRNDTGQSGTLAIDRLTPVPAACTASARKTD